MNIRFDAAKHVANRAKHGVSLALADQLDWASALLMDDQRADYGERRQIGFALLGVRLYCVVFTERGEQRRIISLRKANSREVRRYVSEN